MTSHDPDELWPKLEKLGLSDVEKKLSQGVYGEGKKPVVEQWVANKREALEASTYMYHPKEAPDGKIFKAKEVPELEQNGWFDTPAMFPNTDSENRLLTFLSKEWKWLIATVLVIIGLIIAAQ